MSRKWYRRWFFIVPAVLVLAPVAIAIFVVVSGGIVMLLWNWLLPPLFGLPSITVWQGFGLLALGRILFGGFGGGGRRRSRHMSPEDRERFRRRMSERSCRPSGEVEQSPGTHTGAPTSSASDVRP
jgi:hypothetical protein